jgi:hypothetical protein
MFPIRVYSHTRTASTDMDTAVGLNYSELLNITCPNTIHIIGSGFEMSVSAALYSFIYSRTNYRLLYSITKYVHYECWSNEVVTK